MTKTAQYVQSVDLLEGQWAKMAAFTTGLYLVKSASNGNTAFNMEKVATDDKNKSATYKTIEGTGLKMFKSVKICIEVTPTDEGSVLHWTLEYEKLNANAEDPKAMLHMLVDTCKDVDDHLTQQANTQSSPQLQCNR
ncbi:MLP-like protein 34 [Pistacia vera]|uniref:MLP-like protein 34 n=1 Tax=Pistacia vera TaxID=55513 RepID=UPI0012635518|nr:MLP-like protein 34 [Pistacia vera]